MLNWLTSFSRLKKISKRMVNIARQAKSLFVNSHELELVDFDLFPELKVLIAGNSDRHFDYLPDLPKVIRLLLVQNCSIESD